METLQEPNEREGQASRREGVDHRLHEKAYLGESRVRCYDCDVEFKADHDCWDNPEHSLMESGRDSYDCGVCGAFLQVG